MPNDKNNDEIDFDTMRAEAFDGHSFSGVKLSPFSPIRKRLFGEIRAACDAPNVGSNDALGADAARLIWLCLQSKEQLQRMSAGLDLPALQGATKPARMQALIDDWADSKAAQLESLDDQKRKVAIELFASIWMEGSASLATPDNAEDTESEGNALGRKKRPSS